MILEAYRKKRDFRKTPEPQPRAGKAHSKPSFVIQEHHASRLHYDFRLEADGVLKSWAVPKKPSLDPSQKRLAVRVEDHPLAYATFEGTIPEGEYGAGTVTIWDHGTYENLQSQKPIPQSVTEGIEAGRLEFRLHGHKVQGKFALIRMRDAGRGKENWLLIKMKDEFAQAEGAEEETRNPRAERVSKSAPPSRSATTGRKATRVVTVTNPDKMMYPDSGITKGEVFAFYQCIAGQLLPHLRDRPATLERLPEGIDDSRVPHFWQKHTPAYYPAWIPRVELPSERGDTVSYVLVNDLSTLLYLVNQGTLTFHVWLSRTVNLDHPDFVLFDLDPGGARFADAVAVAQQLHEILIAKDRKGFLKTSGKTGLHILVPWKTGGGYEEARAWAWGIAEKVVEALPAQATLERSKAKRGRRVYVDVMQNARGLHVVPPYVLRAVPGAPLSTPLRWQELKPTLDPSAFNLRTIFRRLTKHTRDPWEGWSRLVARASRQVTARH